MLKGLWMRRDHNGRNTGPIGRAARTLAMNLGLNLIALAVCAADARTAKDQYPAMAPLEQYLMINRADEIDQARSAAPPSISSDADVLTLSRHGYETAIKGRNGFVCLVQRAWFSGLTDQEFWNPKERAPICFNPQGARSVLPTFLRRTGWVLAGASKDEIIVRTKAVIAANEVSVPEIGAMTYMMARNAYHSDAVAGPWHPHLMFFLPRINVADWGANLPGSPVLGNDSGIEPFTVFFVPVASWSDGTPDSRSPGVHKM
jgi:hypothetical protein